MSSAPKSDFQFLIGGRYRNRNGEYDVLEIAGPSMKVRYDDGSEAILNTAVQARIMQNMAVEARLTAPYSGRDSNSRNRTFFRSIGFLAKRATMLEAIVHPRAQEGFVETYRNIVGRPPRAGQEGYYVHAPSADKWGNELRVTFEASDEELNQLDLGPGVEVVTNPSAPGLSWRINRNAFWWKLQTIGFRMGGYQDIQAIRTRIPPQYLSDFDEAIAETTT